MFCVIFYHFNMALKSGGIESPFFVIDAGRNIQFGQLGTELFFLLSGYMNGMKKSDNGERNFIAEAGHFYKKRFLSIMPMYWISYLIFFIPLYLPTRKPDIRLLWTFIGMDGYLTAHGIETWYLIGEWFTGAILVFYLLFPFLNRLIERMSDLGLILIVVLKSIGIFYVSRFGLTDCDILFYLADFMLGIYLRKKNLKTGKAAACISALLVLITGFIKMPFSYRFTITISGTAVFILLLFIGKNLENRESRLAGGFRKAISAAAGYDFPVFLTHHLIITWVMGRYNGCYLGRKAYLGLLLLTVLLTAFASICLKGAVNAVRGLFENNIRK